jgi:hypothetical protein
MENLLTMDLFNPSTLPNDEIWGILWDLSTFKHEMGFDFVVKKSYIQQYLNDVSNDGLENDTYCFLVNLANSMKTEFLFIKQTK